MLQFGSCNRRKVIQLNYLWWFFCSPYMKFLFDLRFHYCVSRCRCYRFCSPISFSQFSKILIFLMIIFYSTLVWRFPPREMWFHRVIIITNSGQFHFTFMLFSHFKSIVIIVSLNSGRTHTLCFRWSCLSPFKYPTIKPFDETSIIILFSRSQLALHLPSGNAPLQEITLSVDIKFPHFFEIGNVVVIVLFLLFHAHSIVKILLNILIITIMHIRSIIL